MMLITFFDKPGLGIYQDIFHKYQFINWPFSDRSGSGCLFFEFCRVLKALQMTCNNCMYWMFENTAAMPHTIKNDITRYSFKK